MIGWQMWVLVIHMSDHNSCSKVVSKLKLAQHIELSRARITGLLYGRMMMETGSLITASHPSRAHRRDLWGGTTTTTPHQNLILHRKESAPG